MSDAQVTRCPFCQTSFRVTGEHLKAANGSVRCGACLRVFMAELYFLDAQGRPLHSGHRVVDFERRKQVTEQDAPAGMKDRRRRQVLQKVQEQLNEKQRLGKKNDPGSANARPDTKNILRAEDNRSSKRKKHKTREPSETVDSDKPAAVSGGEKESLATPEEILDDLMIDEEGHWDDKIPALQIADMQSLLSWDEPDWALDHKEKSYIQRVVDADHYERFRHEITRRWTSGENTGRWFLLSLLMGVVFVLQYGWFNRHSLSMDSTYRGLYERVCLYLSCDLPDYQNLSEMQATDLVIRPHPEEAGALMVDALLRNESRHQQLFPLLDLRFTNLKGELMAHRRFKPSEYLKGELAGLRYIPPRTEVRLGLVILDPGEQAVNYSLQIIEL